VIVLDTSVVSELIRVAPSPTVEGWVRGRRATEPYTTSVTLAEIGYGIARLPEGRCRTLLEDTAEEVFSAFAKQVLAFDASQARQYGRIVDHVIALGRRSKASMPRSPRSVEPATRRWRPAT